MNWTPEEWAEIKDYYTEDYAREYFDEESLPEEFYEEEDYYDNEEEIERDEYMRQRLYQILEVAGFNSYVKNLIGQTDYQKLQIKRLKKLRNKYLRNYYRYPLIVDYIFASLIEKLSQGERIEGMRNNNLDYLIESEIIKVQIGKAEQIIKENYTKEESKRREKSLENLLNQFSISDKEMDLENLISSIQSIALRR